MDRQIKNALENINLIKEVVDKTQQNFSKTSSFLISIGILNVFYIILEQLAYYFRNIYGYSSNIYRYFGSILPILPLIGYIVIFAVFRVKQGYSNNIDKKLLNVYGFIFIGSNILYLGYKMFLPATSNLVVNTMYRCAELFLALPAILGIIMLGIWIKDRYILILSVVYACVYLVLFASMKEIPYGTIGGVGTRLPLSSILLKLFLTICIILTGVYLKKRRYIIHGNTVNTRSLSN